MINVYFTTKFKFEFDKLPPEEQSKVQKYLDFIKSIEDTTSEQFKFAKNTDSQKSNQLAFIESETSTKGQSDSELNIESINDLNQFFQKNESSLHTLAQKSTQDAQETRKNVIRRGAGVSFVGGVFGVPGLVCTFLCLFAIFFLLFFRLNPYYFVPVGFFSAAGLGITCLGICCCLMGCTCIVTTPGISYATPEVQFNALKEEKLDPIAERLETASKEVKIDIPNLEDKKDLEEITKVKNDQLPNKEVKIESIGSNLSGGVYYSNSNQSRTFFNNATNLPGNNIEDIQTVVAKL